MYSCGTPSGGAGRTAPKRSGSGRGFPCRWIRRVVRFLRGGSAGKVATTGGRSAEKRFHLHLGAHKTGTTYTQTALRINREKLRQARVIYWDDHYTRRSLTPFLTGLSRRKGAVSPEMCRERIEAELRSPDIASARKVVISDENLLGYIKNIVMKKGYRWLVRRLIPIREAFGGDVKVYLTIRNYAEFISSMYCELVTTKPYFPFQRIRHGRFVSGLSWVKVYGDLVKVFGEENVVVFEYEKFFKQPDKFLAELVGTGIDFEFPEKEIRTSPSARAIEFIASEGAANPQTPVSEIVACAKERFPRNPENPPFDPWSPEERALLEERYRRDVAAIPCWRPGE